MVQPFTSGTRSIVPQSPEELFTGKYMGAAKPLGNALFYIGRRVLDAEDSSERDLAFALADNGFQVSITSQPIADLAEQAKFVFAHLDHPDSDQLHEDLRSYDDGTRLIYTPEKHREHFTGESIYGIVRNIISGVENLTGEN